MYNISINAPVGSSPQALCFSLKWRLIRESERFSCDTHRAHFLSFPFILPFPAELIYERITATLFIIETI